jgi:outer membrane protein TolC
MTGLCRSGAALLVLIVLSAPGAVGNTTLDSLIGIALQTNPDIQAAGYARDEAEFRSRVSGALPDPKVMLAALNMPRSSLALDETPMSGFQIGIEQTIPWPGKLRSRVRAGESERDRRDELVRAGQAQKPCPGGRVRARSA